jgi:hypothetical protein
MKTSRMPSALDIAGSQQHPQSHAPLTFKTCSRWGACVMQGLHGSCVRIVHRSEDRPVGHDAPGEPCTCQRNSCDMGTSPRSLVFRHCPPCSTYNVVLQVKHYSQVIQRLDQGAAGNMAGGRNRTERSCLLVCRYCKGRKRLLRTCTQPPHRLVAVLCREGSQRAATHPRRMAGQALKAQALQTPLLPAFC